MNLRLLLLLLLLLLPSFRLLAADLPASANDVPVDLEADQLEFDQTTGRYHALGNVRLKQGPLQLTSQQLWWNQQTGEVDAQGEVHFTRPGEEMSGRRLTYDLQQGTGVVEDGEVFMSANSLRMKGTRLERLGPNRFSLYDARITLCDGKRPAWSIGASRADVTIGRYLTAKHARIYAKDVPFFYTPYLRVPIKNERESGFLMPGFGFSDRRGTEFSTAWYQVLGPNQDATFSIDYLSLLGTGLGLEYRYVFGNRQRGKLNAYTILARDDTKRWNFNWQHFGQLTDDLRLVADIEYVNERDFFFDYGEVSGEYNKQKVVSSLFLNQVWGKASLTGQFKAIKDLETEDVVPWQSAPHVDFSVAPLRLWSTPLYFGLQSSYTRFARSKGQTGARLMMRPTLGFHRYLFKGLELNSEYGYRQRRYLGIDEKLSSSQGNVDFQTRLSSRIYRVYGSGQSRWQHTIEPEINYNYIEENQGVDLPAFDRFDQIKGQDSAGYALVSRLTGKWFDDEGRETSREVAWLKFSQDYTLAETFDDISRFSDLRTQLILRPSAHNTLSFDTYYDVKHKRFPYFSVNGQLGDGKGNNLSLDYLQRRPLSNIGNVDNLNVGFDIALLKPLYLEYDQRYDLRNSTSLEQVVSLDLRKQCWGLKVTLREREVERSILFTLTLSGIGEVGSFGKSYRPSRL